MNRLLPIFLILFVFLHPLKGQELIGDPSSPPPPQFAMGPPPPPCVEGQPGCEVPQGGAWALMTLGLVWAGFSLTVKKSAS